MLFFSLSPSPVSSLALSVTLFVYHFLASSSRGAYSISPSKQTDMFCLVKCALPLPPSGLGVYLTLSALSALWQWKGKL